MTMTVTRSNDRVEIDAHAKRATSGGWDVRVVAFEHLDQPISGRPAPSNDPFAEAHARELGMWYADTLDELSESDLAGLADEALEAWS